MGRTVGWGLEVNVVDKLLELFEYYGTSIQGENAPLMAYRRGVVWRVWTRGQATYCLRNGLEGVGEKWRSQAKGPVAELIPEEFALHSGRIGGAPRLAEMGVPPWVIQIEGRLAVKVFMRYVRSNMEDPL